ncbi:MAG: MBL fold metallo-hydrolase [Candidatus Shapirobacteria bacterium]|nr:MBL fold metallo-hydrolase [Candidatus Shapirobacteria bacterium]
MLNSSILRKPLFWLVLITVLLWLMVFSWPDNRLHLIFCNVGQGDAILITYKQTQILIDGGPDNKVLNCLSEHLPFWDRQLEAVFLTHPNADHLIGLLMVLKRYQIKYFFSDFKIEGILEAKLLQKGDKVIIGRLSFLVLWPLNKNVNSKDVNDDCLVLELIFDRFKTLLTGDITQKTEEKVLFEPVDVLKVAHHGSQYSTSEEFLEKVRPVLAVISVGQNRFGHPSSETLERLKKLGIKVLRTDDQQNIEIVSDGGEWWLGGTKGQAL